MWNSFVFPFFRVDIDIGQESTLSLIISALYLLSIFHILKKKSKKSYSGYFYLISVFCKQWSFYFTREKL